MPVFGGGDRGRSGRKVVFELIYHSYRWVIQNLIGGLFQDLELADEGELFEFTLHGVDDADDG